MNKEKRDLLIRRLSETRQIDYPWQSRIHPLRSFPGRCFVKREDELGFGISGSKIRKYRTLIPDLLGRGVTVALIVGGPHSNNVLGLAQLLIEAGIRPVVFMRGSPQTELKGNHLFIRFLIPPSDIHWVPKERWPEVLQLAEQKAEEFKGGGACVAIIPEGASLCSAVPGATTLALDLVRNMNDAGVNFKRVFIDSGTGMTAAVTLLALSWMELDLPATISMIAGDRDSFDRSLRQCRDWFQEWLKMEVPLPGNYALIYPDSSKPFGSVSAALLDRSINISRSEGMLADLVYTTKHFEAARKAMRTCVGDEESVVVHSGGGLSLSGFQEMFAKRIVDR